MDAVQDAHPLFVMSKQTLGAGAITLNIWRMDGLPPIDARGERLRDDRDNWLSRQETLRLISLIIGALPRY